MEGFNTTEYKSPNCIVRVHEPIRTQEQQKKRQSDLSNAVAEFMRSVYAAKDRECINAKDKVV